MRGIGAAGVALSLMLAVGCSGQDPPPSDATPTNGGSTTSGTSTAATTAPTSNVPAGAPALPEAARQQTPAGAEAFVRHWFTLLNYAYQSGEVDPFLATASEACRTCAALAGTVTAVYQRGNRISGGEITVKDISAANIKQAGTTIVTALFGAAELQEVSADGAIIEIIEADGGDVSYLLDVYWQDSAWAVQSARLLAS